MQELFTLRDISNLLDIQQHRITYLLVSHKVQEPIKVAGRRMFTKDDILRLASYLNLEVNWDDHEEVGDV